MAVYQDKARERIRKNLPRFRKLAQKAIVAVTQSDDGLDFFMRAFRPELRKIITGR